MKKKVFTKQELVKIIVRKKNLSPFEEVSLERASKEMLYKILSWIKD